jgi:hypothetical protein
MVLHLIAEPVWHRVDAPAPPAGSSDPGASTVSRQYTPQITRQRTRRA